MSLEVEGGEFGIELMKALGIVNIGVTALSLHVRVGEIVTVEIIGYPDIINRSALITLLGKYNLVRKENDGD